MMNLKTIPLVSALLATVILRAQATEYFVTKRGNDTNTGTTREAALATVQKGVNTVQAGDTLTIGPGEYHEAVKRIDLGSADKDTIIRAEIAGTVILRGDVPAPAFGQLAGHRFVYVADFDFTGDMPAVNEIDTLTILRRMPNRSELEFIPGTFFHDTKAGKLYIATSDMKPAEAHHYRVSNIPTHGVHLVRPRRVVIEGIAVTGFSAMEWLHYREETAGGVWGMFVVHGNRCVIRDCHAYLNAWGLGMQSGPPGSGDNVIERCVSWANKSAFANGDMGGITVFAARRDVIRDSTAFLNGMYGINIYGTGGAAPNYKDDGGNDPQNRSLLANNLAWGNETADIKIKTGYEYHHRAEHCVSPGLWSVTNVSNGLIGREGSKDRAPDNIVLSNEAKLDPLREFADPDHHDYRLQGTSRFRATGTDGKDRGPFSYAKNIFYVRTDGDDQADGLSIAAAWKTMSRAISGLHAGDTLYVEPGVYKGGLKLTAVGTKASPVTIRGRGMDRVIMEGSVQVTSSSHTTFERLHFRDAVKVGKSGEIAFDNCVFAGLGTALDSSGVAGLRVSHCLFTGFKEAAIALSEASHVDLSGNLYDNAKGPALKMTDPNMVRYSSFNSYSSASAAWEVKGKALPLAEVQKTQDQQSQELKPEFALRDGIASLKNAALFAAGAPLGTPFGPYWDRPRHSELRLVVKPEVYSVSATTANLEWVTSLPATCQLAWGETPDCENKASFDVNCFGTYSLTGLKPSRKYFFRLKSIETPKEILLKAEAQSVTLSEEPISFTTSKQNLAAATFYVATDGDDTRTGSSRKDAWKTIRHAATKVNVGDTVLVAGGKYFERVRFRATGEEGSPITFRSMPGERVDIDGNGMALNSGFVAGGKSHLRFDGFYFAGFNLFPNDAWSLQNSGEFHLYQGKDIQITRCFSEGRGGYSAAPVAAWHVDSLLIKNCVNTYKFGGMYFWRCPNLLIQNTVFAEPMIMAFVHRNEKKQKATMENCIFTDMLEKKAKLNIGVLCCDGENESFLHRNNNYFLRDCIPLEQRALDGSRTLSQLRQYILDPLFADPLFAGDPGAKGNPSDKSGFSPDRMMDATFKVDFDSFFSTNPELIKRGIGLQPEAFKDFHFNKPAKSPTP